VDYEPVVINYGNGDAEVEMMPGRCVEIDGETVIVEVSDDMQ
jgi:hypothetical protein